MTNETAIHRLLLVRHRKDCTELLAEALDMAIEALSAQPEQGCDECVFKPFKQFQPERKKGEWIEYIPQHGKCPFCGNQVDLLGGKENNFCGECGADMRKGESNG